ncbi:alpha/beta fold hydrolase [Sphingomonas sp. GB1N7]|uniref:alpha/beta fold hydrolase n=1 Tax=Parasphingomonas caseinilytica TaxID=3096158 RepID=UPI002FC67CC6
MRETLYLVPGLLCDATIWAPQIAALGSQYDVRVPDLTRHSSITAMAQAVLAESPERISVAGHSMGARVALEMVRLSPTRIRRLALFDTGVHARVESELESRKTLLDLSASEGMAALAARWLPPMVLPANFDTRPDLREALFAMVERMSPEIHRAQITALLERPDASELLETITCPVLIGVGDGDGWSPPERHRMIAAAIPQARYVVFPQSGHMAPLEAPGAVTRAMTQWMAAPAP